VKLLDLILSALSFILSLLLPKDRKLFLFGGRQYGGNTAPLFEACVEEGLRGIWLTRRSEILALGRPNILSSRSFKGLWLAARARGVIFTHALSDFAPVRFPSRRTLIINVWHGMPIKRISQADPRFHSRSYARSNLREMARFDAMFVSSPRMAQIFAETFQLPEERVHVTGQARTDHLLGGSPPPLISRYDPPPPPHSKRLLYCPTWREGEAVRLFPFPDFDLEELQESLEALDAVLYVRTHPNDPGQLKARDRRLLPMQGELVPEVTEVLPHFDALITDYSSIYYDYLLLDRPCIFLPYDLEEYSQVPGFYLPFEEILAGPCPQSQSAFLETIREALTQPGRGQERRAEMRSLIYSHLDDRSGERVLQVIKSLA